MPSTLKVFVNDSSFTDAHDNNLTGCPLKVGFYDTVEFKSTRGAAVTVRYGVSLQSPGGSFILSAGGSEKLSAATLDGTLEATNTRGGTMSGGIDVSGGGDDESLAASRPRRPAASPKKRRAKAKASGVRAR